jgi:hypothetical protein
MGSRAVLAERSIIGDGRDFLDGAAFASAGAAAVTAAYARFPFLISGLFRIDPVDDLSP